MAKAKAKPSQPKRVVVTVTDQSLGDIQEVAKTLAASGLTVDRVLPVTGVVSGTCAHAGLAALRRVPGVESVEEEVDATPSAAAG